MFKISTIDTRFQRRLVVEGKLVEPWVAELRSTWSGAGEGLQGRRLVIDLAHVTVISQEGENAITDLMNQGARFSCEGILTRHVLRRLSRSWGTKCQDRRKTPNRQPRKPIVRGELAKQGGELAKQERDGERKVGEVCE